MLLFASLNVLNLRSDSRKMRLDRDIQHQGVDICSLKETSFHSGDHDVILSRKSDHFSAYCHLFMVKIAGKQFLEGCVFTGDWNVDLDKPNVKPLKYWILSIHSGMSYPGS